VSRGSLLFVAYLISLTQENIKDAFDWPKLEDTLRQLKNGDVVEIPIYDFKTHSR
jgi:uridine kinase